MTYLVTDIICFKEVDNYQSGCDPESGKSYVMEGLRFENASKLGLMNDILDFFDAESDNAVVNPAGDEIGRLDIQVYENTNGDKASGSDIANWKEGKKRLWLVCYTCFIQEMSAVGWLE